MKTVIIDTIVNKEKAVTEKIKKQRHLATVATICLGLLAASMSNAQAGGTQSIYGVLAGKWWQWATETGAAGAGSGPTDCSLGQRGSVWFLAGTFDTVEKRNCIDPIPRGKRLFFPLVNIEVSDSGPDDDCAAAGVPGCTVAQKRELADGIFGDQLDGALEDAFFGVGSYSCQLSATVDGVPVQYRGIPIVRTQSPPFRLGDDRKTVADGHWVLLPRLPKGKHTIHFTGAVCDVAGSPTDAPLFKPEVTYTLRVGRVRHDDHD